MSHIYTDVSPHRRSSESAALGLEMGKLSRVNLEEELLVKLPYYRVNERLLFSIDSSHSSLETPGDCDISLHIVAPSRFSADGEGIATGKSDRTSNDSERCVASLPNQGVWLYWHSFTFVTLADSHQDGDQVYR